jgi:hypothetical protein
MSSAASAATATQPRAGSIAVSDHVVANMNPESRSILLVLRGPFVSWNESLRQLQAFEENNGTSISLGEMGTTFPHGIIMSAGILLWQARTTKAQRVVVSASFKSPAENARTTLTVIGLITTKNNDRGEQYELFLSRRFANGEVFGVVTWSQDDVHISLTDGEAVRDITMLMPAMAFAAQRHVVMRNELAQAQDQLRQLQQRLESGGGGGGNDALMQTNRDMVARIQQQNDMIGELRGNLDAAHARAQAQGGGGNAAAAAAAAAVAATAPRLAPAVAGALARLEVPPTPHELAMIEHGMMPDCVLWYAPETWGWGVRSGVSVGSILELVRRETIGKAQSRQKFHNPRMEPAFDSVRAITACIVAEATGAAANNQGGAPWHPTQSPMLQNLARAITHLRAECSSVPYHKIAAAAQSTDPNDAFARTEAAAARGGGGKGRGGRGRGGNDNNNSQGGGRGGRGTGRS